MLDIIKNWNPDDPNFRPDNIYSSLCYFDYSVESDLSAAFAYRDAEVPFVVRGVPDLDDTVMRWADPLYLRKLLKGKEYKVERSEDNHFMYWRSGKSTKKLRGWKEPTHMTKMTYDRWLESASKTHDARGTHYYFRVSGCSKHGGCPQPNLMEIFDELPIFKPKPSLFMVSPKEQRGIHCRFGQSGVIAENHFDGSRNMIALMGGERRYILSAPSNCKGMHLLPKDHPSGRHSAVDWSNPDLEAFPRFSSVTSNEVVLQPGDVLYLPTQWFHYIVSLGTNYQCNTRSGRETGSDADIHACGF